MMLVNVGEHVSFVVVILARILPEIEYPQVPFLQGLAQGPGGGRGRLGPGGAGDCG